MKTTARIKAGHKERGASLVETAFVILPFLMLLIGILDLARVLHLHQSLTEAVRGAARYGAIYPNDLTAVQNLILYDQTTAPQNATPRFGLQASMVNVQRLNPGTIEERLVLTVSGYSFRLHTPVVGRLLQGLPITAVMPVEVR